ncbi:AbrB/MazE/SpoVT family DNA-binding domain-containing protein [Thiorhodovibrio frisius]|uniref:Regulator of stationary/sporulation gene expression n=1 Tax=Thiorhodovibrio frisius TaxID=631362 RepID=H8Z4U3_9GAMM|nr:AbrB/MazE/SpoVT family DNA-binding domain-containing protein [Thiorhodovibrio frisius]EIC20350.1 regulator of stationary/sporulation gene expression [Thiorhodovibrio frisius]WPL21089.1 transcriptional regulator, AbrB family [Thiorhodovibrio frisius]
MNIIRLSNKGQIFIPDAVRARHHWETGTELILDDRGDALILRAAKPFAPTRVEDGLGCTGYQGSARTLEEMDAGIESELRRRWREDGAS